jgi:protein transport protein SEC24
MPQLEQNGNAANLVPTQPSQPAIARSNTLAPEMKTRRVYPGMPASQNPASSIPNSMPPANTGYIPPVSSGNVSSVQPYQAAMPVQPGYPVPQPMNGPMNPIQSTNGANFAPTAGFIPQPQYPTQGQAGPFVPQGAIPPQTPATPFVPQPQQYGISAIQNTFQNMNIASGAQPIGVNLMAGPPQIDAFDTPVLGSNIISQAVAQHPSSNSPNVYKQCTLNAIPQTPALLDKSKLPFGVILAPYRHLLQGDETVPVIQSPQIIRCRRCRTYINPWIQFIEQGTRWKCNVCFLSNDGTIILN